MIPVSITIAPSCDPQTRDALKSELQTQLGELGIDALHTTTSICSRSDSASRAIEISGLLGLRRVPLDERRRRVESVVRVVIYDLGLDSTIAVDVQIGWDVLRTTQILPSDLQTELDRVVSEALLFEAENDEVDLLQDVSLISEVYDELPQVATTYSISRPMFNRLTQQRLQERSASSHTDRSL